MSSYKIHKDDRASQYAVKIVSKEIPSAIPVYNACKRHLDDINKSITPHPQKNKFPFHWDHEEANRIIDFGEMMINPTTNEYLKLEGFQDFLLGSLYGWRDEDGYRRYRLANISLARKNGKSMIQAILSIYELIFGEAPSLNRQIYIGANTQGQAAQLFEQVQIMMDKVRASDKWLREQTKMVFNKIEHISSYSKIEKVSEEMKNLDGKNPTVFIWDEAHESTINRMYKSMRTGMGQQKNGLIIIISTVGYNLNSPYKKMYDDAKKIAAGAVKSDRTFSYIAEGIKEDIDQPESWIKSNPLLSNEDVGKTMLENMKTDYDEGLRNNDTLEFIVKNLNIWTQASVNSYIDVADWEACAVDKPPSIQGKDVYFGIDLARANDLAAVSMMYPTENNKLYINNHSFVGTKGGLENKSMRDKIDYQMLADKRYATITDLESGIINYSLIMDFIVNHIKENNLNVKGVMYDNWGSDVFLAEFEKRYGHMDLPFVEVGQNFKNLSEPVKQFRLEVYEKNILHNNNPNLNIAVNNAIVKYDNNSNIMLVKDKAREKIDPIVALVTAYSQAMFHEYDNSIDMEEYIMSDDFGFGF